MSPWYPKNTQPFKVIASGLTGRPIGVVSLSRDEKCLAFCRILRRYIPESLRCYCSTPSLEQWPLHACGVHQRDKQKVPSMLGLAGTSVYAVQVQVSCFVSVDK